MSGYVYAIDAGSAVKIGYSRNPMRRFTKMMTDNHEAASMVGYIRATINQEKELHELLQPWRLRREWYRKEGPVLAFVASLPPPPPIKRGHGRNLPGNALRDYRLSRGMNSAALAEMIGVTQSSISRIERGLHTPSLALAERIRKATNGAIQASDLVDRAS